MYTTTKWINDSKTAKLAMSFAFFDKMFFSFEILSIVVSIDEFIASVISMMNIEEVMYIFFMREMSIYTSEIPVNIKSSSSSRKARSLIIKLIPDNEFLKAQNNFFISTFYLNILFDALNFSCEILNKSEIE